MIKNDKLKLEIRKIIVEMGDSIDIPKNTLEYIMINLVKNGFNHYIEFIGEQRTREMIAHELKLTCDSLLYQSSVESVIELGLSQFFTTSDTTIATAARHYAEYYHLQGNIYEVLNHVISGVVNPIIDDHPYMSLRDAIIYIGQGDMDNSVKTNNSQLH